LKQDSIAKRLKKYVGGAAPWDWERGESEDTHYSVDLHKLQNSTTDEQSEGNRKHEIIEVTERNGV